MGWFLLRCALAADGRLPTWSALEPLPEPATPRIRMAPDGSSVLWIAPAGDQQEVHLLRVADGDRPSPLVLPSDREVRLGWSAAGEPFVHATSEDGPTWHALRDGAWSSAEKPTPWARGFPAAPNVTLSWTGEEPRWTASRVDSQTGETTDVWQVRLDKRDRTLIDEAGKLRAVGELDRRGRLRYRAVAGEPRLVLPDFQPVPHPGRGSPLERRVLSRPIAMVGDVVWALDGRGRPNVALVTIDAHTGETALAAEVVGADLINASTHPDTGRPDLVLAYEALPRWVALDPALEADLAWVQEALPRTILVLERARGDRIWTVCGSSPSAGVTCLVADRDRHALTSTLSRPNTAWDGPQPETWAVEIPTSDGLVLDSYLVLPTASDGGGRPTAPLPTVLRLHGGPYARVAYQYDPSRAWLASRGYAVLDLNFRGSTLMGTAVLTGADGERGRATQRDVAEATAWLIREGIADPSRIALMGQSFGGYSTLLGLAQAPDSYACGVALAPMAGWSYRWVVWALSRGLKDRAPYTQLASIDDPLLLVHGTADRVLPVAESRHVAEALGRRGSPVASLEVDDGHSLQADGVPAAIAEAVDGFLAGCLGGERGSMDPAGWPEHARIVVGEALLTGR